MSPVTWHFLLSFFRLIMKTALLKMLLIHQSNLLKKTVSTKSSWIWWVLPHPLQGQVETNAMYVSGISHQAFTCGRVGPRGTSILKTAIAYLADTSKSFIQIKCYLHIFFGFFFGKVKNSFTLFTWSLLVFYVDTFFYSYITNLSKRIIFLYIIIDNWVNNYFI